MLVDGYNLLHASGQFGHPSDPPTLENARRALLDYLTQQISERDRTRTTVVFDGKDAPPGLPAESSYEKMRILFSRRKMTADQLIADMIADEKDPRQLRVVSSDHGVQRAARQRGVAYIDSEAWLREIWQNTTQDQRPVEKSEPAQSAAEVQQWVREFMPPTSPPAPHVAKPVKKKARGKS